MAENVRILVVEDDESIRRLIRTALGTDGYSVTEAGTGEEGLQLLDQGRFDLIVLDLHLPGVSGWDVLEVLRKDGLRDQMRVIILTAQAAEREILRGWRMGVDHYCMKPFEPEQFLATVHHVVTASDEDLTRDRQAELQKTQLLNMVDSVFDGQ